MQALTREHVVQCFGAICKRRSLPYVQSTYRSRSLPWRWRTGGVWEASAPTYLLSTKNKKGYEGNNSGLSCGRDSRQLIGHQDILCKTNCLSASRFSLDKQCQIEDIHGTGCLDSIHIVDSQITTRILLRGLKSFASLGPAQRKVSCSPAYMGCSSILLESGSSQQRITLARLHSTRERERSHKPDRSKYIAEG